MESVLSIINNLLCTDMNKITILNNNKDELNSHDNKDFNTISHIIRLKILNEYIIIITNSK